MVTARADWFLETVGIAVGLLPTAVWPEPEPARQFYRTILFAPVHESASLIGRVGSSAFRPSLAARQCHSRARASLRNRHIGPSIMGFEDEVERSFRRPCRRQVQADSRTRLIHRPARDISPPLGGAPSFAPIAVDLD